MKIITFKNDDGTSAVVVIDKLCCWQECPKGTRLYFDGGQCLEVGAKFEDFSKKVLEMHTARPL